MAEGGNTLSRNPNVCASCSSLADGMEDGRASGLSDTVPAAPVAAEPAAVVESQPDSKLLKSAA